jgi:hypothetical protein
MLKQRERTKKTPATEGYTRYPCRIIDSLPRERGKKPVTKKKEKARLSPIQL